MNKLDEININPFYQCQLTDRMDIENLIEKCVYNYIKYGYYNYLDYDFYDDKRTLPAFRISSDKSSHYDKTQLYKEFVISFDTKANLIKFRFVDKYSQSKFGVEFNYKYTFPFPKETDRHIFLIDFDDIKIATLVNILHTEINWLRKTISSSMSFNEYFPIGSKWKHFKGYELTIISVAQHTETGETLVVYECRNPNDEHDTPSIWARPMSMFFEMVDEDKYPEHKGEYRITRMSDT